jgi:hypothetical protein
MVFTRPRVSARVGVAPRHNEPAFWGSLEALLKMKSLELLSVSNEIPDTPQGFRS